MTVRTLLLKFMVFALPFAAFAQAPPSHYTILPLSQAGALLRQCSRGSPTRVTGFWTPSAAQIIAVERRLPDFLRESGHAIKLSESRRQYVGVISAGKRLIYVNAFPASFLRVLDHADWKAAAFIVCDGGDECWGAEFDPATNSFRNIEFNGVA